MDRYRFFAASVRAGVVELPDDQAHHALHVLRLQTGVEVEVFDGKGNWGRGILETTKRAAGVDVKRVESTPPPADRLTLATAVPKADRAEWLVEQASQLNASAVQWISADRGVVKPREGGGKMEKFQKLAIESAKQCGRNWVLEMGEPRPVAEVVAAAVGRGETVWWLEPREGVELAGEVSRVRAGGLAMRITALIGPEGGWSQQEMEMLAATAGVIRVRLTPTILRIETACAAVAAVVGVFA